MSNLFELGKYTGLRQCECGAWPTIGLHPYHTYTDPKTQEVHNSPNSFGVYCQECKRNTSVIGGRGRYTALFAAKIWNRENSGPFSLHEDFTMVNLDVSRVYMGGQEKLNDLYVAARVFDPHPKYEDNFKQMELMSIFDDNVRLLVPKVSVFAPQNGSMYASVTSFRAFKPITEFAKQHNPNLPFFIND